MCKVSDKRATGGATRGAVVLAVVVAGGTGGGSCTRPYVTCPGTANTSVEQQSSFNFVILVLGMDYFDSGPGFRNLTQTHLLKPSELTHKLPRDVVEASIPVLSCVG